MRAGGQNQELTQPGLSLPWYSTLVPRYQARLNVKPVTVTGFLVSRVSVPSFTWRSIYPDVPY